MIEQGTACRCAGSRTRRDGDIIGSAGGREPLGQANFPRLAATARRKVGRFAR
jgi:hypothetical protein